MGIIDGEPITMIGKAPMGDPIEFSVQGYRISLRKLEAARVQIARTK
jgi:ferrous iron transport protein A